MANLKKIIKRYATGVQNVASDIMSAPARYYYGRQIAQSAQDAATLKAANKIPNYAVGSDFTDPNFRLKMEALRIKQKYSKQ